MLKVLHSSLQISINLRIDSKNSRFLYSCFFKRFPTWWSMYDTLHSGAKGTCTIKIFHERPLAMNVASKNWFEISLWFRESKRRNKFPPAVLLSESITNVLRSCRRVVSVYAFTFSVSLMKWFATNSEHNIQWLHWDSVLLRKKKPEGW